MLEKTLWCRERIRQRINKIGFENKIKTLPEYFLLANSLFPCFSGVAYAKSPIKQKEKKGKNKYSSIISK